MWRRARPTGHQSDLPDGNSPLETAVDTLTLALIAAAAALLVALL